MTSGATTPTDSEWASPSRCPSEAVARHRSLCSGATLQLQQTVAARVEQGWGYGASYTRGAGAVLELSQGAVLSIGPQTPERSPAGRHANTFQTSSTKMMKDDFARTAQLSELRAMTRRMLQAKRGSVEAQELSARLEKLRVLTSTQG